MKIEKIPDGAVETCPEEIPAYAMAWIRERMREDPVILYRPGRVHGTCCTCGDYFRADATNAGQRFTFLSKAVCPSCGTECVTIVSTSTRDEADMQQDVCFFQGAPEGFVWLRQFHVRRDHRVLAGEPQARWYEKPEDWLVEFGRIALRDDAAVLWLHEGHCGFMGGNGRYRLDCWERKPRVYVCCAGWDYRIMAESWARAVEAAGLPVSSRLRYLDLPGYLADGGRAPILFAARWARYPAFEMLYKAGFRMLADEKVHGGIRKDCVRMVRLDTRDPKKVLALPKTILRLLPPEAWTHRMLCEAKIMLEAGTPPARLPGWLGNHVEERMLRTMAPLMTWQQMQDYLKAQNAMPANRGTMTAGDYTDYIADCRKLGADLTDKTVLFPRDLRTRHEETAREIAFREHEISKKEMAKRVRALMPYALAADGLLIRPAESSVELTAEGKALHHCVGTYSERYASGETEIWFVRRAEAPDEPYYTCEYRNGHVVQCRTLHNRSYDTEPAVHAFVQEWTKKRRSGYFARRMKKAAETAAS